METTINNLSSEKSENNILVYEKGCKEVYINFNRTEKDFYISDEYIKFIKSVEQLIRKSKEYRGYIAYLKEKIGLKQCSVFSNINDDLAKIEMHHGPIFTLFDYVEIASNASMIKNKKLNSFIVAKEVLQDHYDNIVQVVMISESVHKAIHGKKTDIFIPLEMSWGDLVKYIEKYGEFLNSVQVKKINDYMKKYRSSSGKYASSFDNFFKSRIKNWSDFI